MNNEKYLQFTASLLIALMMAIPFYTTSVYAAINKVTVKGSNGIEGFARANDFLNFNVHASISDDNVTRDQVILGSDMQFGQCMSSINNGSECTLRFPANGTASFELKSVPFTISLFKDDKTLNDSKSSSITIDNKAPDVRLSAQPKFSSQQNVVVNYNVTDFACDDSSCINKCVGIKSIEFYTSDGAFRQAIEPPSAGCSAKSSISIDPKTFNDGKNSIFAKAADKFDQVSQEKSVTFSVDASPPALMPDSFEIKRKGISLSTFSANEIPVEVSVNISGSDLNHNAVTADLSALNPARNLKNAKASCTTAEKGISTCRWAIELNPKTGGLKTAIVNVSDTAGNKESFTVNKLLSLDGKGPVVLSLSTDAAVDGRIFAKPSGNRVSAVFEEASGIAPNDVFLHVGGSKVKATGCSRESNWACTWENVNFGGSARIAIEADTADILGNFVSQSADADVSVDKDAPLVRRIDISPVGGLSQAFPGFFKIGDKIAVTANITEDNDVFAVADFSNFVSGSKAATFCERIQSDEHICTWISDSINLEASDVITFNFSDNAGNTLIVTKPLKTFGLENATVPDFWTNTVECSPPTIDRELGPLINQRVFCEVDLEQKLFTKPVSTVFIAPAACDGDKSIVQSIETFNTEAGVTSLVIRITLKKSDFRIDKADLSCSLAVFSRIGASTSITKNPEIENVKISLKFSNLPLGELSAEVKDKIKDAKDDAENIWEVIGALNRVVFYAKKICQIINTVYNSVAVLYSIAYLMKITDAACASSGILQSLGICTVTYGISVASCESQQAAHVGAQGLKKAGDKFCSYVNCRQTILWGPHVQNWINNIPFPASPGQYLGPQTELKGKGLFGQEVRPAGDKYKTYYDYLRDKPYGLKPVSEYMDARHNLIVATLFACVPGVIYGLDKYRQIKCLYADCLQNAVGKEGKPITICEDLKDYTTCKYVTGEIFAVIPWTAVFDHFFGLIKNAVSNPFAALGVVVGFLCKPTCPARDGGTSYGVCEFARLFNSVGDTIQNVISIKDEGFKIRQDYCSRLDWDDDKDVKLNSTKTPSKSGLFKK